jgi:hypothetical protein
MITLNITPILEGSSAEAKERQGTRTDLHHNITQKIEEGSEGEAAEQSLIENIQREDLKPQEKGKGLAAMKGEHDNKWLAKQVGLSEAVVCSLLSVATLDDDVISRAKSQDATTLASIARITNEDGTPNKSLQLKVAEKTKDWTNKPLKLPFFGVISTWKVGGEGDKWLKNVGISEVGKR